MAQGDPKAQVWEFHRNANRVESAMNHFVRGISKNKFADTITTKIGYNLTEVTSQSYIWFAADPIVCLLYCHLTKFFELLQSLEQQEHAA